MRGIDPEDFRPEENYVEIHHRSETDTPLKNGNGAERHINLHSDVSQVIKHTSRRSGTRSLLEKQHDARTDGEKRKLRNDAFDIERFTDTNRRI